MPNRRRYTEPRKFVTPTGTYPDGPFEPSTPAYASTTAQFAANLRTALAKRGWSIREAARRAGITHGTLINILAGTVVPDLGTVTALEHAVNEPLYPLYETQ